MKATHKKEASTTSSARVPTPGAANRITCFLMKQVKYRHLLLLTGIWVLLVLYPNPLNLARSIHRIIAPPVEPAKVARLLAEAPSEPEALERFVLEKFPYQYDWVTYGMPWYFPTLDQALAQETGDCKTRFIVLASLFEALEIPYQQSFSLSHFWVHYEGKEENSWEMEQNAFLVREDDGALRVQVPREERRQIYENFRDGFWRAMPGHRKALLMTGPLLFMAAGLLLALMRHSEKTQKHPLTVDAS
ncbi:hypothetical protein [Anoxynatronum buryatiense]|uniref:Transglutaminase domain-containing protein n=1 Tax=Anoxynatronum buryatiense TaxID=489973 RepID=A0AA45WY81_9CLOT|nr:hypothetical protein [Anoxynatronum buryatiense]SMP67867.1 hypothetical protein SAMN06296020_11616 [Anoxynatronum buryatiense]